MRDRALSGKLWLRLVKRRLRMDASLSSSIGMPQHPILARLSTQLELLQLLSPSSSASTLHCSSLIALRALLSRDDKTLLTLTELFTYVVPSVPFTFAALTTPFTCTLPFTLVTLTVPFTGVTDVVAPSLVVVVMVWEVGVVVAVVVADSSHSILTCTQPLELRAVVSVTCIFG